MLLINAVNAAGRPVELFVKDGKIAAVGQDLSALAGEGETVLDAGGLTVLPLWTCTATGAPRALNIRRTLPPEAWLRPQAATPLST